MWKLKNKFALNYMQKQIRFKLSLFNKNSAGFTLVELAVVIAIIGILSAIILFSVTQYIGKSKDANIMGNLAVLVSSGEVFYNSNQSYDGFCNSTVVTSASSQMPDNSTATCYNSSSNKGGICCSEATDNNSWAACAQLFTDNNNAYCVDSRGVKKTIDHSYCIVGLTQCP